MSVPVYTQGFGTSYLTGVIPFTTAPTTSTPGVLGQFGIVSSTKSVYVMAQQSTSNGTVTYNWELFTTGSGSLSTLTTQDSTVVVPTLGNINLSGASNQLTTTGSGSTATVSLVSALTAPGSVTATTSLTATLGNITATNGNLVLGTAGNKIVSTSVASTTTAGANSFGSVTLSSGTATVATTAVTASSLIFIWRQAVGASTALGQLTVGTISAATSFVINAATQASPGTPLSTDDSVVGWMIVN